MLLQVRDSGTWLDVVRFSVAHANNHMLQHHRNSGLQRAYSTGPLNTVDDVEHAYRQAVDLGYPREQEYLQHWQEGRP